MYRIRARLARLEQVRVGRTRENPWAPLCAELGIPLFPPDMTLADLLQGLIDEEWAAAQRRPGDSEEMDNAYSA